MTERSSLVPIAIAVLVVLLLGWWLMAGPTTKDAGTTRTSGTSDQSDRYEQGRNQQATVAVFAKRK